MALTDTTIRNLKPEGSKRELLIADSNGLYLRVRLGKGRISRTWQWRRKEGGVVRVVTFGAYPSLSLREARLLAAEQSLKRQTHSPTVEEAAKQWMRERVDPTHKKAVHVHGYVERAIIPDLGSMRVRDVEPSDIANMVRAYRDRVAKFARARTGGRAAARALLIVAKGLFDYTVALGWVDRSPAAPITQAAIGAPLTARSRVLTDGEIRWVMACDSPAGPTLRFLLATGLRISEAFTGQRAGQYWEVAPHSSKNGRAHRVWLSDVALAQLEAHPWAVGVGRIQNWLTATGAGWTAHDLRRSFSTRMNEEIKVAPHIVEVMLNHRLPGMMAIYNRADYDAERRDALEAWSAWLLALADARPADVVPLRPVAANG